MQRFRKNQPVVIEAMHFDGSWASAQPILAWLEAARRIDQSGSRWSEKDGGHIYITSPGGWVRQARADDWILRDEQGEFSPCAPDIFAATYTPLSAVVR